MHCLTDSIGSYQVLSRLDKMSSSSVHSRFYCGPHLFIFESVLEHLQNIPNLSLNNPSPFYLLCRLCEDCIGRNAELLGEGLTWLPPKLQDRVNKRVTFFFNSPTLIEKKQQDVV